MCHLLIPPPDYTVVYEAGSRFATVLTVQLEPYSQRCLSYTERVMLSTRGTAGEIYFDQLCLHIDQLCVLSRVP